ncbi:hypothetical protein BC629DRAFT_1575684 [Irpex lacteus]|nr:hypothetical protein BC629DRAFT_1575684 [Irpex lacteus]
MSQMSNRMGREQPCERGERVLQFWMRLVRRCKERGIWLEDCVGVNVSVGSLMRMRDAAAASQAERF